MNIQQKWDMYWMTAFVNHPKSRYKMVVDSFAERHPNHPLLKRHPKDNYYKWTLNVEDFVTNNMFVMYEILLKKEVEDLYDLLFDIHEDYDFTTTKAISKKDVKTNRNISRKYHADRLGGLGFKDFRNRSRFGL